MWVFFNGELKTNSSAIHEKSGEKTFTLKECDCDVLSKNNIASTVKNFK